MNDGRKTPTWDDTPITVRRRVLQQAALALSPSRGLIQRLESHPDLDARDRRALNWGYEAYLDIAQILDTPAAKNSDPVAVAERLLEDAGVPV